MKLQKRSVFEVLFGDMGELIQFFVAFFVLMGIMMAAPLLFTRMSKWLGASSEPATVESRKLSQPTSNLVSQLTKLDSLALGLNAEFDSHIESSKEALEAKKHILLELQSQVDSLEFTPSQRALLADYTPRGSEELSFSDWITRRSVLYDILVAFVISTFFYILGRRKGRTFGQAAAANSEKQ